MKGTQKNFSSIAHSVHDEPRALGTAVTTGAESSASTAAADSKPVVKTKVYDDYIDFSWVKVPGATKYRVYSCNGAQLITQADTTSRHYLITDTVPGLRYSIAVRAYVDGKWTKLTKKDIVSVNAKPVNGKESLSLRTDTAETKKKLISYMKAITTEQRFYNSSR